MKQTTDRRFVQANREALAALGLGVGYFIWWYVAAYGFGSGPVAEYSYVFGFPAWFFYSCVAGFLIFSILAGLMVRLFFKDIPLLENEPEAQRGNRGGEA